MGKSQKNKAGLHKKVSSVLKGVSIPQGVHDLQPTDTSAPDKTADVSAATTSKVSSVFKDATAPSGNDARQPAGKHVQDQAGERAATAKTKNRQPPPSPRIERPHRPERPAAKAAQPKLPKAPNPDQVTQSLPKSISARQPKADIDHTEKKVSQKSTIVTISSRSFLERTRNKLFTSKAGVSDTKQKTMAAMMPVLFIILLVFVFKGGVFGTKVRETEASGQDNVTSVATADSNNEIDWEIPAPYPTTLRDPMRLGPAENAQTETETETRTLVRLIVQGILYSEDKASAVIGNQIVHEGEKIRGMTIIRIGKDTVEFEMNGKRWTQKVRQ